MALALTGTLLAAQAVTGAAPTPAEALARRVDLRQKGVRDLTARFVQSYRSGVLGREVVERGTLAIKKPGRMRWEYKEPEHKLFVSDGKQFFFYVPADRQVIVKEQAGEQGIPAFLLAGQGILEQFQVFPEPPLAGRERLRLVLASRTRTWSASSSTWTRRRACARSRCGRRAGTAASSSRT